jgi:hypothetical protein
VLGENCRKGRKYGISRLGGSLFSKEGAENAERGIGRMEDWKVGRLEGWKDGRLA